MGKKYGNHSKMKHWNFRDHLAFIATIPVTNVPTDIWKRSN